MKVSKVQSLSLRFLSNIYESKFERNCGNGHLKAYPLRSFDEWLSDTTTRSHRRAKHLPLPFPLPLLFFSFSLFFPFFPFHARATRVFSSTPPPKPIPRSDERSDGSDEGSDKNQLNRWNFFAGGLR